MLAPTVIVAVILLTFRLYLCTRSHKTEFMALPDCRVYPGTLAIRRASPQISERDLGTSGDLATHLREPFLALADVLLHRNQRRHRILELQFLLTG